jgi:hypothetical protein
MPMPTRRHFSPEEKAAHRAAWLDFMARIGVQPRIDPHNGDLHIPLGDLCRALNCTEDEVLTVLGRHLLCMGGLDTTVPLR